MRASLTLSDICFGGKGFTDQDGRQWMLKYLTVPTSGPLRNPESLNGWIVPTSYGSLFITDGGRVYQPYVP